MIQLSVWTNYPHTNRRTWSTPTVSEVEQTRCQVLRFEGAKYIFRGKDFCICYMFKTIFLGAKNLGVTKHLRGIVPEILPWLQAWRVCCQIVGPISFNVFDRCLCKIETRACETLRSCTKRLGGLAVWTLLGASRSFTPALNIAQQEQTIEKISTWPSSQQYHLEIH